MKPTFILNVAEIGNVVGGIGIFLASSLVFMGTRIGYPRLDGGGELHDLWPSCGDGRQPFSVKALVSDFAKLFRISCDPLSDSDLPQDGLHPGARARSV